MQTFFDKINRTKLKSYLLARHLVYHLESIPIAQTQKLLAHGFSTYKPTTTELDYFKQEILTLIAADVEGFTKGYFPKDKVNMSDAFKHSLRYMNIVVDNIFVAQRKKQNKTKHFTKEWQQSLDKYPEYYQRNFHFQTNGYLSDDSAELYEHQVEILFKGTASPMRRSIISLLKKIKQVDGSFLELGVGVGSTTDFMAYAYPDSEITCIDLSESYLYKAKKNLAKYKNIYFQRAQAENLPFKKQTFDMVYSSFLMHELPREVRMQVLQEVNRVLEVGGRIVISDSTQLDDKQNLNWAIKDFPRNFHEPYYMDYIKTPLEAMLVEAGFEIEEKEIVFLTKNIVAKKV